MKSSYNRIIEVFDKLKLQRIKEIGKLNKNSFTRKRCMDFSKLSLCILSKKGISLNMELEHFFKDTNNFENTISKQAFSKQRMNLNPQIFKVLNQEYIQAIYDQTNYKTFHGYIVLAIDGSVLELPNTDKTKEIYGGFSDNNENIIAACAQASGIYDCLNHIMIDSIIETYKIGEIALAIRNIEETLKILKDKKILLIFDRGYPSIWLIHYLNNLGVKYLFRIQNQTYKKEKNNMKSNDEYLNLEINQTRLKHCPNEKIREELKNIKKIENMRFTKVKLKDGTIEDLVSNIEIEEIPYEEMKELYYQRWQIELSFDVLKNKLEIENFSGKSKITIEQDFYAQILLYNMLEDIRIDAGKTIKRNNDLKYEYKINMNSLVGLFKMQMIEIAIEDDDEKREKLYLTLLEKIKKNLIAIKPDRVFSRNKKLTNNKYKPNMRRNI